MKLTQLFKSAIIGGVGAGILIAVLNYLFGWYGPQTIFGYVGLGLACGVGIAIGEFLRQKSK